MNLWSSSSFACTAQENDVAGTGVHLEHRAAAVQAAFGGDALGAIVPALRYNLDLRKIGLDPVPIAHVNGGVDGDRERRRQVNGDVAGRGLQGRVAEAAAAGDKLRGDATAAGFGARALAEVHQLNAAAATLGTHGAIGQRQMDAAAARVHFGGPVNLTQLNAAAARRGLHPALAAFHLDAAAAGFQESALQPVEDDHAAAAGLGGDFALGGGHADAAAAGLEAKVGAGIAHVNAAAPGAAGDVAADAVQLQAATAAGSVHAAGNVIHGYAAAISFHLGGLERLRNLQGKIRREVPRSPADILAFDHGQIAALGSFQTILFESPARFLLRRGEGAQPYHIVDCLLRAALNFHRTHLGAYPQTMYFCQ